MSVSKTCIRYCPDRFAADLDPIREKLLAYACRTRPCTAEQAEDLVGDAVHLGLLNLDRFDALSCTLSTWLTGILKNVILRDRAKHPYWTVSFEGASEMQIPSNPNTLLRDALQPHIDLLNWHLRDVLNLYLDGYPQTEIAKTLHITENTVALRIGLASQELHIDCSDFEDKWDMGFFDWCAEHATYNAPPGMSETWRSRHPRDKALQPWHPHWKKKVTDAQNASTAPKQRKAA